MAETLTWFVSGYMVISSRPGEFERGEFLAVHWEYAVCFGIAVASGKVMGAEQGLG